MPPQRTERPLQWVDLTDFRAGIHQRSNRALGTVAVPAPLGAAQQTNTYRCCALPSGGLAPLPKQVQGWSFPVPDPYANVSSGYWTTGFFAHGPMTVPSPNETPYPDQLFLGYDYVVSGIHRHRQYRKKIFFSTFASDLLNTQDATTSNGKYQAMCFGQTRGTTVAPYTAAGSPEIASAWYAPAAGTGMFDSYTEIFPRSTDYSSVGVQQLVNGVWRANQLLTHQGRIVTLEESDYFLSDPTYGTSTNEQISFTDPPNSLPLAGVDMATQREVFVQEYPSGYGAWGSISAGELMLIKHQGGGVMVSGDIANPTITRLAGVTGTGWALNRAASTPQGLFYAALEEGVYSWRGGDTSQKMSAQLDDNFWINSALPTFLNQYCCFEAWGDWVLCSNNWLYDTGTGGWWQLDTTDQGSYLHYARSFNARYCYAAVGGPWTNTTNAIVYTYDRRTPATNYSWQSHPIPASINKLVNVREMVLVAQGSGTVTVTLTDFTGSTQPEVFTITNTSQPQRLRPKQGGTFAKGYNVVVRIVSDGGTGPAPVVHSLHLGTETSQSVVNT